MRRDEKYPAAAGSRRLGESVLQVMAASRKMGGGVAKQECDTFTRELILDVPKRGRGRPRLDNPKSPAERAAAYRMRKRNAKRLARLGYYHDPQTGQTWSGRGLMPKWLAVKVREGVDKSLYLAKA